MKKNILIVLSVIMILGIGLRLNAQETPVIMEDMETDIAIAMGGGISYDCQLFDNADYYLRFVYLYAGQHTIAGRAKLMVYRREGEFIRLRVEYLTGGYGWEILESHLYVGTEPPKKMAPGKFPYQQETPSGLTKHVYYIDLEDIGVSFENLYIAIHAVVRTTGQENAYTGECLPADQEETAWGFKTLPMFYPVMNVGDTVNPDGNPWGTIFPKKNKQWPAYFLVYIPYNVSDPWFECPQPLQLIFCY